MQTVGFAIRADVVDLIYGDSGGILSRANCRFETINQNPCAEPGAAVVWLPPNCTEHPEPGGVNRTIPGGVASSAPIPAQRNSVVSKIQVLNGDADPLAPFDQVAAFRDEMRSAEAGWELDIYGGALHSFTGEGVLDQTSPEAGLHPQSETRSWPATVEFLAEVLQ